MYKLEDFSHLDEQCVFLTQGMLADKEVPFEKVYEYMKPFVDDGYFETHVGFYDPADDEDTPFDMSEEDLAYFRNLGHLENPNNGRKIQNIDENIFYYWSTTPKLCDHNRKNAKPDPIVELKAAVEALIDALKERGIWDKTLYDCLSDEAKRVEEALINV